MTAGLHRPGTTWTRGAVDAAAVLLDVALIGDHEAQRRVMALWQPGSRLLELDGRWLLTLPLGARLRVERGPGLPLVATTPGGLAAGLAAPGLTARAGQVVVEDAGVLVVRTLDDLPRVALDGFLDLGVPTHPLQPCDAAPEAVAVSTLDIPSPDLRALAGVGAPSETWPGRHRTRLRATVALLVLLVALVAVGFVIVGSVTGRGDHAASPAPSVSAAATPTPTPSPSTVPTTPAFPSLTLPSVPSVSFPTFGATGGDGGDTNFHGWYVLLPLALALVLYRWVRGRRGRRSGPSGSSRTTPAPAASTPRSGLFARALRRLLRPRDEVRGRQLRYLRRLTADFHAGNWDSALRSAIALGGPGSTNALTLRMPRARSSLELGRATGSRVSVGFAGEPVRQYLRDLYDGALRRLVDSGRFDEAAFLQAEILFDVRGAVSLLERHDRLSTAAALAEARALSPELVVRLWFRAGDQQRAVDVARARGAFAAAVAALADVDPAAARSLRLLWIATAQRAGDHHEAVRAAWPDPELRPLVAADLQAGVARDDTSSGWFLAHVVAHRPDDDDIGRALNLLAADGGEVRGRQDEFVTALDGLDIPDRRLDRLLCGAALRTLLGQGNPRPTAKARRRLVLRLRERADAVLAADLPPIPVRVHTTPRGALLVLPAASGEQPVHDAAVLADGRMLVATGESGLVLVSPDGRPITRWRHRRVDRIVLADHGTAAVLVGNAGGVVETARLSLETFATAELGTFDLAYVVDSFDGSVLTTVDERGILFLDTLERPTRVLWHELDENHRVLAVNRTADTLTAFVASRRPGGAPVTELRCWRLPDLILRVRAQCDLPPGVATIAALPGQLLVLATPTATPEEVQLVEPRAPTLELRRYRGYAAPVVERTGLPADTRLLSNGELSGLVVPDGPSAELVIADADRLIATVAVPSDVPVGLHDHAGLLTVFTADGRVAALRRSTGEAMAQYRTQA